MGSPAGNTYNKSSSRCRIHKCGVQGFPTDIVPISEHKKHVVRYNLEKDMGDLHVNWTLLLQYFIGRCGFIVECDISSNFFHEFDFLIGAGGPYNSESIQFCKLDYQP